MRGTCGWIVLSGAIAFGQSFGTSRFDTAPPEVDQALRARIAHFYQSHVDGKFRQADQAVHEDSKDIFFGADKTKFAGYRIVTVTYQDDFKKAKVVVDADDFFVFPGVGKMKINRAISSTWKTDGGQWWWYVEPPSEECVQSPAGCLKQSNVGDSSGIDIGQKLGPDARQLIQRLQNSVKLSKPQLDLHSINATSDEVLLTNQFEAPLTLKLSAPDDVLGFVVKLDKEKIEPGESAKLIAIHKPQSTTWKPDLVARVAVDPTGQTISIPIVFAYPPKPASPK